MVAWSRSSGSCFDQPCVFFRQFEIGYQQACDRTRSGTMPWGQPMRLTITPAMQWVVCAYIAGLENSTSLTCARFQARVVIRAVVHAMSHALLQDWRIRRLLLCVCVYVYVCSCSSETRYRRPGVPCGTSRGGLQPRKGLSRAPGHDLVSGSRCC